jgi:hypothetical protein
MLSLSEPLFGCSPPDLAFEADLPVAFMNQDHCGMIDVAHYFNRKTTSNPPPPLGESIEDVNCVPHYDPGLFSISFYSSLEGLQLLEPATNMWVDGPINTDPEQQDIAVLWLGQAALKVNASLKNGIHRVIYPQTLNPRLTMWYEVCTVNQVVEPEDKVVKEKKVKVPNLVGGKEIEVKEGEKLKDVLQKIERFRGVPTSKTLSLDDQFKIPYDPEFMKRYTQFLIQQHQKKKK